MSPLVPEKRLQKSFPLTFLMENLFHRLYGLDAPGPKAAFTLRTTSDDIKTPDDVVQCRPAFYMYIMCQYPKNMAADVADVVVASATFLYVFEEEENDEKERRRRDVCDKVYA